MSLILFVKSLFICICICVCIILYIVLLFISIYTSHLVCLEALSICISICISSHSVCFQYLSQYMYMSLILCFLGICFHLYLCLYFSHLMFSLSGTVSISVCLSTGVQRQRHAVRRKISLSLSPKLPRWPSRKASASRAEDPRFKSRLRRDFFGVESYQ